MRSSPLLLGLLIVSPFAAVIGCLYFVHSERMKIVEQNERRAMIALLKLKDLQREFRSRDSDGNGRPDYWVPDIAGLFGKVAFRPAVEAADATPGKPGSKPIPSSGSLFTAVRMGETDQPQDRDHYGVCAYPAAYPTSGRRTFLISDAGVLHAKMTGGSPIHRWPATDLGTWTPLR